MKKAPKQEGSECSSRVEKRNDSSLAVAQRVSFLGDIGVCGELCMAVPLEMLFIKNL